ncbi:MAG TPA: SRPBCC domain-containing protein [Polyangiales bacterium]|nr:SRPBCC domain-containing protein [Polyangiales bacterium]
MPVKKDASGRRSVEAEVEVPGTPEEVWGAIATGPGISSWFVPTQVEEKRGGAINASFGPNMDSVSKITEWDPPRRFAASSNDMGPGAPSIATEWMVEARGGGNCVVRVVHSWFADSDDWDGQWEETRYGWIVFFRLLRIYLADFTGQHGKLVQLMAARPEPKAAAWAALVRALGIGPLERGLQFRTSGSTPALSGRIERVGESAHPEELILRLETPAPGFMHLFAMPMGGQTLLPMRMYLFGASATKVAAEQEPLWSAWVQQLATGGTR